MFSFFNESKSDNDIAKSEAESVKIFLKNSNNYQKMKISSRRYKPENNEINVTERIIEKIEKSVSYLDLQFALENFDVDNSDVPFQSMMGRHIMSAIMFTTGFFKEDHNFSYYAIRLFMETDTAFKSYHQKFSEANTNIRKSLNTTP
jgi:hypothetical protein